MVYCMVWCISVWYVYGGVERLTAWYHVVYGMIWYGMTCYGKVWEGVCGMVWYGMVWYTVWHDMICYGKFLYGMA